MKNITPNNQVFQSEKCECGAEYHDVSIEDTELLDNSGCRGMRCPQCNRPLNVIEVDKKS